MMTKDIDVIEVGTLGEDLKHSIGEKLDFALFDKKVSSATSKDTVVSIIQEDLLDIMCDQIKEYYKQVAGTELTVNVTAEDLYNIYIEYSL